MKKEVESKLNELIPIYQENKLEMDSYKKLVDRDNKEIKKLMLTNNLPEYTVNGLTATCSISERTDFNEELLIKKLKEMKVKGVIKKKEYVDMDALESEIYKGNIPAIELAPCQTVKEVVTLKIKKG